MSQLEKRIKAKPNSYYRFRIALDYPPRPETRKELEQKFQEAMSRLGVPAEQVSVFAAKSAIQTGSDMFQKNESSVDPDDRLDPGGRYLLCILIRTEEGGFTENPAIVAEHAAESFARFAAIPIKNVAAVVLEDAYLEVETRDDHHKAGVLPYA